MNKKLVFILLGIVFTFSVGFNIYQYFKKDDVAKTSPIEKCEEDVQDYELSRFKVLPPALKTLAGTYKIIKIFERPMKNPGEENASYIRLFQEGKKQPAVKDLKQPLTNVLTISFRDQEYSDCVNNEGCSRNSANPEAYIDVGYGQPRMHFEFPVNKIEAVNSETFEGSDIAKFEVSKKKIGKDTWEVKNAESTFKATKIHSKYLYLEWINAAFDKKKEQPYRENFFGLIQLDDSGEFDLLDGQNYLAESLRDHCNQLYDRN